MEPTACTTAAQASMATGADTDKARVGHPLDMLTAEEIAASAHVCKKYAAAYGYGSLRFNSIMLQEPPKAELLQYERGEGPTPARRAQCIVIAPSKDLAIEAIVSLDLGARMETWKELVGVQPMTTPDDNSYAEVIMKRDSRVQQLLKERYGITNMDQVVCDTWACHGAPEHLNQRRLMQGFLYMRSCPNDNEYAHPIDLVPIVDLNRGEVVHIDMYDRPPPVPMQQVNYHRELQDKPWRQDLKPLNIIQPEGPSFKVQGRHVSWQKWQFRVGFNGREGLVLHNVGYEDQGRLRPVLHRASLVEMIVPYGDPNYPYIRKSALDVGDYGMGFCANSLQLGCDCLGHIHYFDAMLNDHRGQPLPLPKAVCMHEEDSGILYKHFDCRTGHVETRRARRLVVSSISTFMNYEYAAYWYLYQDGSIHFELKLTGILSTSVAPVDEHMPAYGVRVAPGVNATLHQHFFCMRLDPAMDDEEGGKALVVAEVEAQPLPPGPGNPHSNGFCLKETDLLTTDMAQRCVDFGAARCWKIKNPGVINPVSKEPVAYKLLPSGTPSLMAQEGSLVRKRGVFATRNMWVTPHRDEQRYPAGEHVVQSKQCMGLAEWTKENKSLVGADPVVWYSFGITHAPRIEDFPIMPVEIVGFAMKPSSFFTMNPALDLPPERNAASRQCGAEDGLSADGATGSCCGLSLSQTSAPSSAASTAPVSAAAAAPRSRL